MTKLHQLAPGFVQQLEESCRNCRGMGEIIDEKDKCKKCNGRKTVRDRKILEVNVEKGMRDGQKIVFSGEGDQDPDLQPGDIVIVLDEKEHPIFKRSGQDLIMHMQLQLVESLCGFQKIIRTLDDRDLLITSYPGEVLKHEAIKYISGEGMPQYKNPFEKGRLIIQFFVAFPDSVPIDLVPSLEQCLPGRPVVKVPEDAEECNMVSKKMSLLVAIFSVALSVSCLVSCGSTRQDLGGTHPTSENTQMRVAFVYPCRMCTVEDLLLNARVTQGLQMDNFAKLLQILSFYGPYIYTLIKLNYN